MKQDRTTRIRRSPNFDGHAFRNLAAIDMMVPGSMPRTLWHQFAGREQRRPPTPLPQAWPGPHAHREPPASGLRVTWLGHSTLLLELGGVTILTDPVWAARASPLAFAGPRRFQPNPIPLAELPAPDVILLSHDHYDHLDKLAIRQFAARPIPFVTPLGVGAYLEAWGVPAARIHELDWWEDIRLPELGLEIAAVPAQHFSGRTLRRNATLWASWVVATGSQRIHVGGDSGFFAGFAEIGDRYGPFDLASIEIGQYDPTWPAVHMTPEEAVRAALALRARALLPVHWGAFALAFHAWDEPIERLVAGAEQHRFPVVTPRLGEPIEPASVQAIDPWWRLIGP